MSEGLVDVLVVGMGYMPFALNLDSWKAMGEHYEVPIYPSIMPSQLAYERMERASASHEHIRGAAAWWWQNGVDGIYLFNLFTQDDVWGLDRQQTYAPLKDIGGQASLAGKDKLYGIESIAQAGMFSQATESLSLPVPLDIHERRLALAMGPDANDPNASFQIHTWTSGGSADTRIWMRLNHTLLEPVRRDGHYYTVEVPVGVMRVGRNDLTIFCNSDLAETTNPIIVQDVLASVIY